jgi:hypothetical protein
LRRLKNLRTRVTCAAVLLALLVASTTTHSARQQSVPSPRDVLGFTPGDDYKLADFSQVRDYFRKLDAASDRVQVSSAGTSTEGREMLVAVISSEANLARLDRYKDIARKLARVRGVSDEEARDLAAQGKAIVWIDNGLHASEVATAQHSLLLAWRVATDESAEMRAIRDNVILVLLPTINPDGLDMVVDWYRRNLGTPYQDSPMPWLYQKYVGHDNNRDFYMQTQAESRVVSRLLYSEWLPQVLYNQHQGTWPPRIFVPPFPDPFNPNIDPLIMRSIDLVGGAMLHRFEREGKGRRHLAARVLDLVQRLDPHDRVFPQHRRHPDGDGPRLGDALHVERRGLPEQLDDGIDTLVPSTNYPSPWKGGTLHLADAVDYMLTGSLAVLDTAAKYREDLLYGIYQVGARQIAKGTREAPVAYVIPVAQHDRPAAALFVETLMRGGVDVHRADSDFTVDGATFDAGSWIVRLDQPFRPFAKDLLEPQRYPDLRASPGGPPIAPYDTAGWTLSYQMGVKAIPVAHPLDVPMTKLEAFPVVAGRILEGPDRQVRASTGSARTESTHLPATYILDPATNNSFRLVNALLASGISVARANTRPDANAPGMAAGRVHRHGQDEGRSGPCGERRRSAGRHCRTRHANAARDRAAAPRRAHRDLQELDRQHRRRLDALGTRAIWLRVHDPHGRGRQGRPPRRALRRCHPALAIIARHCRRPWDRPAVAERAMEPRSAGVPWRHRRRRRGRVEVVRAGRRPANRLRCRQRPRSRAIRRRLQPHPQPDHGARREDVLLPGVGAEADGGRQCARRLRHDVIGRRLLCRLARVRNRGSDGLEHRALCICE